MPSSHSQFVAFFASSISLFLLFRHRPSALSTLSKGHSPIQAGSAMAPCVSVWSFAQRAVMSILTFFGAVAVAFSRVYLNYHTLGQVLVGFGAGVAVSGVWYCFGTYLRTSGWLDWVLDTDASRMFRMRDLLIEEDLTDAGWQRWNIKKREILHNKAKKAN